MDENFLIVGRVCGRWRIARRLTSRGAPMSRGPGIVKDSRPRPRAPPPDGLVVALVVVETPFVGSWIVDNLVRHADARDAPHDGMQSPLPHRVEEGLRARDDRTRAGADARTTPRRWEVGRSGRGRGVWSRNRTAISCLVWVVPWTRGVGGV